MGGGTYERGMSIDVGLLIATGIASAAAVAAVVVALLARADSKSAGARAQEASERAAGAAERLAQIQGRTFDGPPWRIEWWGEHTFLVTNESPVDAHDVVIGTEPRHLSLVLDSSHQVPFGLGAKSAFKFAFAATYDDGFRRDIVLTWRRDGDDRRRSWSHPIPDPPTS